MNRRGPSGPARLLCIDKPVGPTSFDVVRQVRWVSGQRRVGHAGTLDPFATGLLVIGLGPATRLLGLLAGGQKVYHATICFGIETESGDPTGTVVDRCPIGFAEDEVRLALRAFLGPQLQVPPRLSAIHVGGRRSYDRARAGEEFELAARPVEFFALELLSFDPPRVGVRVTCSGGTYIRSLARDLGRALGSCAHLEALRRERVGVFGLDEAIALDALEERWDAGRITLDPVAITRGWPRLQLDAAQVDAVHHGRQPDPSWWAPLGWIELPERVALVDEHDQLVAVAARCGATRLGLNVVLPTPATLTDAEQPEKPRS